MNRQPRRSALWLFAGAAVVVCAVWVVAGCGGDDSGEVRSGGGNEVTETSWSGSGGTGNDDLDRQITDLEALVADAIEAMGLDPSAARREVTANGCVGAGAGTEGYNIRYYFAAPDVDEAVDRLAALEGHWDQAEGVEITSRVGAPGEPPDFLAQTDELVLGAKRFPASEELYVGGSTGCW